MKMEKSGKNSKNIVQNISKSLFYYRTTSYAISTTLNAPFDVSDSISREGCTQMTAVITCLPHFPNPHTLNLQDTRAQLT